MAGVDESGAVAKFGNALRGLSGDYDKRLEKVRPVLERVLQERGVVPVVNEGAYHENPTDRMFGQYEATMSGRPAGLVEGFNKAALGDLFLSPEESAQNKTAGDMGRAMAMRRQATIDRAAKQRADHVAASRGFLAGLYNRVFGE